MNNRIRVLRAEKGWSQAELAERVQVSLNSINAVENGKFDPSLPLAFRIADAFGLKIEDDVSKGGSAMTSSDAAVLVPSRSGNCVKTDTKVS